MTFSKRSISKLATCHKDLQLVMETAIEVSRVDFGVSEGHRSIVRQLELFNEGFSQKDGIVNLSNHNYTPSRAADIFGWVNGRLTYKLDVMCYLAGLIEGISEVLYNEGRINHKIRWGGNWDMDGEILTDQSFDDTPHFELLIK